jgi:hypothetical protein
VPNLRDGMAAYRALMPSGLAMNFVLFNDRALCRAMLAHLEE